MKIYTGTGDAGETGLFGGVRVKKSHARVEAYGTIDETSAAIGVARAHGVPEEIERVLVELQSDLFTLGSELSSAPGQESRLGIELLGEADVMRLENAIDEAEAVLAPLKNFILAAGTKEAAALHLARTVARRAERRVIALSEHEPVRGTILVYLNRLADLLFVLARRANFAARRPDEPWAPRGLRS
jgi:cob(I)alamin adenosyltransferase